MDMQRTKRSNDRSGRKDSRTYLSMLAHAAPIRNAWRLGGFMVMCLVIGCRCPTTPPVAAEGPQSLARALDMGVVGGGGPGQGAPVCFHGAETESHAPYDVCIAAAPDSVCGGGWWCAALPTAMLGRTKRGKWVVPLHLLAHDKSDRLTTRQVLATASWGLHFTWACEDDGRARQRGRTVILAPTEP
jgi:hypothetical protein